MGFDRLEGTRDAYGEELRRLGGIDPRIVVLTGDLAGSTKTSLFAKEYPHVADVLEHLMARPRSVPGDPS